MKKVTFNSLIIEITHRCNMNCAHCLRGDAENIDMKPETVDALLDQTQAIYNLTLSGGEPFLNLDLVEHIAEGIEKRGVELFSIGIITNGTILDGRAIKAMKRFNRIVQNSRPRCGLKASRAAVMLGFSMDKYHEHQDLCKANMEKYKNASSGCYDILIKQCGNDPSAKGRALQLDDVKGGEHSSHSAYIESIKDRRIEILSGSTKPLCPEYRTAHLYND